jgi:hypothetical protein
VLSNYQVVPAGTALDDDPGTGMTLYRTRGPLRVEGTLVGLYPDRWSGPAALWTQYGCRGGTLRAHVLSDPALFHRGAQTITAMLGTKTLATRSVPSTHDAVVSVPLPRHTPVCAVNFIVTPTAAPAQAVPGNGDTRTLGIRFLGFDYRPR